MRKSIFPYIGLFVLLTINAAILLVVGRAPQQRIAILTGFDREAAAFEAVIDGRREDVTAIGSVVFGTIAGRDVLVVAVGPGMTNAAARTQSVLDRYPVSRIIMAGTAGGLQAGLEVGDVVIPAEWRSHQYGEMTPAGFTPSPLSVLPYGQRDVSPIEAFAVDAGMLALARELAGVVPAGTGVSGDVFVSDPATRAALSAQFDAAIVDMETTAVAQVAALNGIPFIAVRGVSDLAGIAGQPGDAESAFTRPAQTVAALIALLP